jgi:hypothetical protein
VTASGLGTVTVDATDNGMVNGNGGARGNGTATVRRPATTVVAPSGANGRAIATTTAGTTRGMVVAGRAGAGPAGPATVAAGPLQNAAAVRG